MPIELEKAAAITKVLTYDMLIINTGIGAEARLGSR
jgi:hypothetical protein